MHFHKMHFSVPYASVQQGQTGVGDFADKINWQRSNGNNTNVLSL